MVRGPTTLHCWSGPNGRNGQGGLGHRRVVRAPSGSHRTRGRCGGAGISGAGVARTRFVLHLLHVGGEGKAPGKVTGSGPHQNHGASSRRWGGSMVLTGEGRQQRGSTQSGERPLMAGGGGWTRRHREMWWRRRWAPMCKTNAEAM
jgi:hypothetical protein